MIRERPSMLRFTQVARLVSFMFVSPYAFTYMFQCCNTTVLFSELFDVFAGLMRRNSQELDRV